jgi:hypothetical protein
MRDPVGQQQPVAIVCEVATGSLQIQGAKLGGHRTRWCPNLAGAGDGDLWGV